MHNDTVNLTGHYPTRHRNVLTVVQNNDPAQALTTTQFAMGETKAHQFSPYYGAIWNPLRQNGATLHRPIIIMQAPDDVMELLDPDHCMIQELGCEAQPINATSHAELRTMRTGGFTKFRIGLRFKKEWFDLRAFFHFDIVITSGYITDVPIFTPEEIGTASTFPAHVGGIPSLIKCGGQRMTVFAIYQE